MRRLSLSWLPMAVFSALLVWAPVGNAETERSPETGTRISPSARQASAYWGLEPALGVSSQSRRSDSGRSSLTAAGTRATETAVVFEPSLFWQWRLSRTLWLGPKLSWNRSIIDIDSSSDTLDASLFGTLRYAGHASVAGRFVFGLGPYLSLLPAPRSFTIQHDVAPAFGVQGFAGIGLDRTILHGRSRWHVDLRVDVHGPVTHRHTMTNSATGASLREPLSAAGVAVMVAYGIGFHQF